MTHAASDPRIVTLGEIIMDMFPQEIGRSFAEVTAFLPKPGGAPANVAVAAARLGTAAAYIGKVGEDAFGHVLVDVLRSHNVETRGIAFDPDVRTTMVFITMPDENTQEFVFYRNPGADLQLRADELDASLFANARAFHFGSLSLVEEPARSATYAAIEMAKQAGALVSFDVNYRPTLWSSPHEAQAEIRRILPLADLLKVNEVEIALLGGSGDLESACRTLLAQGPSLIVVTLGAEGSFFCTSQVSGSVAPFRVKTVDSTGCGDAFIAGLLTRLTASDDWRSLLTAETLRKALTFGNAVGALTALTRGVIPALPSKEQVQTFLQQQGVDW
jgi:fructokinase